MRQGGEHTTKLARAGLGRIALVALALAFAFAALPVCLNVLGGQSALAGQDASAQNADFQQLGDKDADGSQVAGQPGSLSTQSLTPGDPDWKPSRAYLAWQNPATNEFEPCDDAHALIAADTAHFEVFVVFEDGTEQRASEAGYTVKWKLANDTWGGETLAVMDSTGTVTLQGAASKVVQVSATCGSLNMEGGPAFVNLVNQTAGRGGAQRVTHMDATWSADGGQGSWNPFVPGVVEVPRITSKAGAASVSAGTVYGNWEGIFMGVQTGDVGAKLTWRAEAFFDESGARSDALLAHVSADGEGASVTATGAGDGWAVLRCDSLAYPDFGGQEVVVRVTGNSAGNVQANTVASAQLLYQDGAGLFHAYDGFTLATSPTSIDTPFGSVAFDVRLKFANGSTARASELGMAVDWSVKGVAGIAEATVDGVVRATHAGNGRVRIAGAAVNAVKPNGIPAYVRITNNDAGVKPQGDALSVEARSNYWMTASGSPTDSDNWCWRSTPNSGDVQHVRPLVVGSATADSAECNLTAQVTWSDGTVTSENVDRGVRHWGVMASTDQNGNICEPLVTVDENGVVKSTEKGSGFATISCTTDVPVYDEAGERSNVRLTGLIVVGVFQPTSGVRRMVLLDRDGNELKTTSLVIPNGDSLYQFYVRVFFRDGSTASSYPDADDFDAAATSSVKWAMYRDENRDKDELYSSIEGGRFHADVGFSRGYASASLEKASFSGKDVECGVTVIAEDSIEELGQTDSMTVTIYHYSDYKNHGADAPVAKEVTLTRAQLEAFATYSTWYTFLMRNGTAFATVYARGVAMENLLALCGVESDKLISMVFTGSDGYAPERHSAQFILGSQYRYTNYYYHLSLPGLMREQSVAPMLALEYYMKNNGGYEDATDCDNERTKGFDHMVTDSTLRIIFGMTGPSTPNARLAVTRVSAITMVIEDTVTDEEGTDDPSDPKKDEKDEKPEKPEKPDKPDRKDNPEKSDDPTDPNPGPDNGIPPSKTDPPENPDVDAKTPQRPGDNNTTPSGDKKKPGDDDKGGTNPYEGGKHNEGVGTDRKQGNQVALTRDKSASVEVGFEDATNDVIDTMGAQHGEQLEEGSEGEVPHSGETYLREMSQTPEEDNRMIVPPAEIGWGYWATAGSGLGIMLVLGMGASLLRYRRDDLDGKRLARRHGERSDARRDDERGK